MSPASSGTLWREGSNKDAEGRQEGRQERGQQEGILQGVRDLLRQTLDVRFSGLPESLLDKIEQCQDVAALRAFHQQALTARSAEELQF